MQCTGSELRLSECAHSGVGVHNCRHIKDAGVRCLSGERYLCAILLFVIVILYIPVLASSALFGVLHVISFKHGFYMVLNTTNFSVDREQGNIQI